MSDSNELTWVVTLVSLAVATPTAGHAIIYKRGPRSAILQVLLIALLPLAGSLLYGLFGINRYQRWARRLFPGANPAVRQDLVPTIPQAVSASSAGLAHLVGRATGQPLTSGDRIEPLVDGEQAYPAILTAIESAWHSAALALYIFNSQDIGAQLVGALRRAHECGVQVRVLINDVYAHWLSRSAYCALQYVGAPVATFNPTLIPARLHAAHLRSHRKLPMIDGETGFTGGMNVRSPYWRPDVPEQACHDLYFRLRRPVVAHPMRYFINDWYDIMGERLSKGFWGRPPATADEQGTSWARGIEVGPDRALDRMRWTFMGALSVAKHLACIWIPCFVPDQPMIAALSTAASRGVHVEVLTPANGDHPTVQQVACVHYWQVLEHGVRIFERPGPFDHSKLMLIDGQWCCLGSANWDVRSLRLNLEFNMEVYDITLSTWLGSLFDAARNTSNEMSAMALRAHPLAIRLRDGVARLFTPILQRHDLRGTLPMEKRDQWNIGYRIVAGLLLLTLQNYWQAAKTVEPVPYSEFEKALAEGRVAEVLVSNRTATGRLKLPDSRGKTTIVTTRIESDLTEWLSKYDVPYAWVVESTWLRDALSWILPVAALFGIWSFLFRRFAEKQSMGGFLSIGKSCAKVFMGKNTGVTFTDVAGVDEVKAGLVEIVDFLKNPQGYRWLGARIPKDVLLVGPSNTGKILLTKAVTGGAGVPFFSVLGSEFVEMFVDVGVARVCDPFKQARGQAPAIIFIDKPDALGRARGVGGPIGGHDECEQTLNQLLTETDGSDSSVGLIILIATNRPEILNQALLRAGRFDRQALVDRPDKKGRLDILKVHVKKVTLAQDVNPGQVAVLTTGFSGADFANLVSEAALATTRHKASVVELQDFTVAIEHIVAGLEKKNRVLNPKERETVAYHKMGYVLVVLALPGTDPVHKISIVSRGIGALGYTLQRPTEDRFLVTRIDLEHKITVPLGGRAAEKLVFGELFTGALDDLARATDIARDVTTRFGMDEGLGYVASEVQRPRFLDAPELAQGGCRVAEPTQTRIGQATRDIVMGVFDRAY